MKTYSIGELSNLSGISSQAIRYYERENLMPEPPRTEGNYRRFTDGALARLQFILHAKQWGFSLDEIRELLLLQDANGDRAAAKHIAEEKLVRIREQIANLSRVEAVLAKALKDCSGKGAIDGCPIIEALADSN